MVIRTENVTRCALNGTNNTGVQWIANGRAEVLFHSVVSILLTLLSDKKSNSYL